MSGGSRSTALHGAMRDGHSDDQRLISREATAADIAEFYGPRPHPTLKALVTVMNGEVAGVIGLAREGSCAKYFSEFKPQLRPYLKTMTALRTIQRSMDLVRQSKRRVFAIAQADEPQSHHILQRLGFVQVDGDVYRWPS